MSRTAEVVVVLAYLGLLLVLATRPRWFIRLTDEAKRRAKELRGTRSW